MQNPLRVQEKDPRIKLICKLKVGDDRVVSQEKRIDELLHCLFFSPHKEKLTFPMYSPYVLTNGLTKTHRPDSVLTELDVVTGEGR